MAFRKKNFRHMVIGFGGGIVLAIAALPAESYYNSEPWVWIFFIPSIVFTSYGIYARWFVE